MAAKKSPLGKPGEALVFLGEEAEKVRDQIRMWSRHWLSERDHRVEMYRPLEPEHMENENRFEHPVLGPMQYLEMKTEINRRRISGIVSGEVDPIPFSQVEKLFIAMDKHYLLDSGEIQVVPNPKWSNENFAEWMNGRACI